MSNYRDFNVNNRSNLFVRFAADPNGTDFSDKPSENRRYIGVLATGHRLNQPIKEDFDGLWQVFRGRDGANAEVSIDPVTHTCSRIYGGTPGSSIPPLRMPRLFPHDICHEWNISRWLPAIFHCTKRSGVPRGPSQHHSISVFSEAP